MKLLVLFILCSNALFGQVARDHFSVVNGLIIWERSIPVKSFSSLLSDVKESGVLLHLEADSNQIRGDLRPTEADYRIAGYSRMGAPSYLFGAYIHGFVVIKFNGFDSALIIIKRIEIDEESDKPFAHKESRTTLEGSFLKIDKVRNSFYRGSSRILDQNFIKLFDYSK